RFAARESADGLTRDARSGREPRDRCVRQLAWILAAGAVSEPVPQGGDLDRGFASGLRLLRALALRQGMAEDGTLVNDDRADLDAVPLADGLGGGRRLSALRRRGIDDGGHRLAG